MATSRQIVLELLVKMDTSGSYSNIILDNTFSQSKLSPRDKAFAAALFYGVLERKMTLDYIIRQYSSVEFDKISVAVVQILRMGLYQLLYMNSVPESAAVNESVILMEKNDQKKTKGFINAILRSFIRSGKTIDYGDLEGEAKLSIEYSCPKWLVKKWTQDFGEERVISILKASFGRPPLYVRVNTLKTNVDYVIEQLKKEKIHAEKNCILEDCLELKNTQGIDSTNTYRKGLFHVQDISSQICCKTVNPIFNETVLDLCSAPGGKSFTMAQLMANRGRLYSYDLYEGKVDLLNNGAKRLGITVIKAGVNDASYHNPEIPMADKVLCDVPCSGLGVIRRKPEIKYKKIKDLETLPETQSKIIENAASYVKVGGTLVYSTCTLNKAENDDIVDAFLEKHKDEFAPIIVPIPINGLETSYKRTIIPSETGGDGFFIATLRRIKEKE